MYIRTYVHTYIRMYVCSGCVVFTCCMCVPPLQSEDSTVFFLSVKEAYDPIGFIQTPSPVTSMMWSHHVSQSLVHLHVKYTRGEVHMHMCTMYLFSVHVYACMCMCICGVFEGVVLIGGSSYNQVTYVQFCTIFNHACIKLCNHC